MQNKLENVSQNAKENGKMAYRTLFPRKYSAYSQLRTFVHVISTHPSTFLHFIPTYFFRYWVLNLILSIEAALLMQHIWCQTRLFTSQCICNCLFHVSFPCHTIDSIEDRHTVEDYKKRERTQYYVFLILSVMDHSMFLTRKRGNNSNAPWTIGSCINLLTSVLL